MAKVKTDWRDSAKIVIAVAVLSSPLIVFVCGLGCWALSGFVPGVHQTASKLLECSIYMFFFWIPASFLVGALLFNDESSPRSDYDQGEEEERRAYRHP